ncbi:MAG TPA: hypothetical protein VGB52_14415 [Actinomycetota bacterium]
MAADVESAARLRRAAGLEVQVMDVVEGTGGLPAGPFDVIILDGAAAGAREAVPAFRAAAPDAAIVWVGADPPDDVHQAVPDDGLNDALPGAIVKALLARGR